MSSRMHLAAGVLACTGAACAAPPPMPPGIPAAQREAMLRDAAGRQGVDRAAVGVVSAAAVTWPDGSLGCPQPGLMATQALVPGWRVELAAPGRPALLYHASRRGGWLWCPRERAVQPLPPGPEAQE